MAERKPRRPTPASPPAGASDKANGDPANNDPKHRTLIAIFTLLLLALLSVTVLFAFKRIAPATSATSTYVVYVLAGMASAVLSFGLLSSAGAFKGSSHGAELRLGGAIVALAVVAGGGALFERYKPHNTMDIRLFFNSPDSQPASLSGQVDLAVGSTLITAKLNDNTALFQQVPSSWLGTGATVTLHASPFRLASTKDVVLEEKVTLVVERDPSVVDMSPLTVTGTIRVAGKLAAGAQLDLVCAPAFSKPNLADNGGRLDVLIPPSCRNSDGTVKRPLRANIQWAEQRYSAELDPGGFELNLVEDISDAGHTNAPKNEPSPNFCPRITKDQFGYVATCDCNSNVGAAPRHVPPPAGTPSDTQIRAHVISKLKEDGWRCVPH